MKFRKLLAVLAVPSLATLLAVPLFAATPRRPASSPDQDETGQQLIVLLRKGAVAPKALRLDLDGFPTLPLDRDLETTLRSLGVPRLERLIQRSLNLPPVNPDLVPAGHEDSFDPERLYVLRLPPSARVSEALERLNALPAVIHAEPSTPAKALRPVRSRGQSTAKVLSGPPNDPEGNWGLNAIGAGTAWLYQTGRPSVRISLLDTGGETNHPDLGGGIGSKLVGGYDFVHGDSNFYPDLSVRSPSHGMSVAGIAAGLTNNGIATPGVCGGDGTSPGCQVLLPKILGDRSILEWVDHGLAWLGNHDISIDAIYWSLENGADVLSNSWCADRGAFTLPYTVHAAFRDVYARGVLNVAAMGNSNGDCNQNNPYEEVPPASYGDIMTSVGAVDTSLNRVVFPEWQSATGVHIDLAAPGDWVGTLELGGGAPATDPFFDGTSAATPFVSGAMGLVLSEIEEQGLPLFHSDVPSLLSLTATDRGALGFDVEYGAGVVNVGKALQVLQPPYTVETGTATPASGCYSLSDIQQWVFMHDFDLYLVRRCEIRRPIQFSRTYQTPPLLWGRPMSTGGITPSNPNGQVTWTGVVPGSVTTTGAQLRTYVYERWTISGAYLGWYPRAPQNTNFAWALTGIPAPPAATGNPFTYPTPRDQFLACYGMAGQISSNCRDISDFNDKQMCYGMSDSTQSPCTQMTDRNLQLACYGMSIDYSSNCRDITDPNMRLFCYGVSENNSTHCGSIANANTRQLCYAMATSNSSYCSSINNANDRQFCYGASTRNNTYCASIR